MKAITLSFAFALASGCVTSPSVDEKMATWNGEKADHLVEVWGTPSTIDNSPSGTRTYVYEVQDTRVHIVEGGMRNGPRIEHEPVACTVRFTVDATNTVRSSQMDASTGPCNDEIAGNPKQMIAH